MKLVNDLLSDKLCFALNHPTDIQVEQIVDRIMNNRRWTYVMLLVDENFENDELLGIIDFETICSYTWVNTNISSVVDWHALILDPNLCYIYFFD
jgi:hypothetical protein